MWIGSLAACGASILQRRAYEFFVVLGKKEHREIEKIMQE
jgi:hypothetical protein